MQIKPTSTSMRVCLLYPYFPIFALFEECSLGNRDIPFAKRTFEMVRKGIVFHDPSHKWYPGKVLFEEFPGIEHYPAYTQGCTFTSKPQCQRISF